MTLRDMTPPAGVWLRAGTPVLEPYPCMCWGQYPCGRHCPCRGRADVDTMPSRCCERRAAETRERGVVGR